MKQLIIDKERNIKDINNESFNLKDIVNLIKNGVNIEFTTKLKRNNITIDKLKEILFYVDKTIVNIKNKEELIQMIINEKEMRENMKTSVIDTDVQFILSKIKTLCSIQKELNKTLNDKSLESISNHYKFKDKLPTKDFVVETFANVLAKEIPNMYLKD